LERVGQYRLGHSVPAMDGRGRRSGSEPAGRATPADPGPRADRGRSSTYLIRVEGQLDDRLAAWSDGTSVTREDDGDTVLTVPQVDQAALLGLLRKLRDLGARLVSVNPVPPGSIGTDSTEGQR
jgi:hypothetical protein